MVSQRPMNLDNYMRMPDMPSAAKLALMERQFGGGSGERSVRVRWRCP